MFITAVCVLFLIKQKMSLGTRFREKNDDLSLASQAAKLEKATILHTLCMCMPTPLCERALMTRKSCVVGMRNAIRRTNLIIYFNLGMPSFEPSLQIPFETISILTHSTDKQLFTVSQISSIKWVSLLQVRR